MIVNQKKKFKVLTICSWYPNKTNPTLGNFVQKHSDTIALYNHAAALSIFPSDSIHSVQLQEVKRNDLNEIIVYYPRIKNGFKPLRLLQNFISHRKAFKKGYQRTLELIGKPDVVHLNIVYPLGIWALWLKLRHKIPYVVSENSSGFHVESEHAYPPHILRLCKLVLRHASVLLPVSKNLKSNLERLVVKKRFEIICNVVDENLFSYSEMASKNPNKLIHISTGIDSIKNISGMVRVVNQLYIEYPDLHLDIVSDGDLNYAEDLHKSLGSNTCIDFYSTKTTVEIAQMIGASDALLMFSNYENFPCVIAEAMMSGKPVISSNVNGIPEHVHSDYGILVEPQDEQQLTNAIYSFLVGERIFEPNKIRAYAMEHFSYAAVGKKFTEVYQSLK